MMPNKDQSQQVQEMPKYGSGSLCSRGGQMETTGTRSMRAPYGNQSHQIQVNSSWDHCHKVQERRRWQQDSPSPGETQVATSHQIQVRTS